MNSDHFAGLLVAFLHTLLVVYVVSGPFLLPTEGCLLIQYLFILFFLVVHWVTSNDTCAMSMLEASLRNIEVEHTFVHSVVSPVYKMQWSANGYTIIALLFCIALYRVIQAGHSNFVLPLRPSVVRRASREFTPTDYSAIPAPDAPSTDSTPPKPRE